MRYGLGAVLIATVLAGCGTAYASLPATLPSQSLRSYSQPLATPQAVVGRATSTYKALNDFTGEVTTWTPQRPGDERSAVYGEATIVFKKARMQRLELTKASDDPGKVGTVIVTDGSDKARVLLPKAIPILGRLFSLKLTDKRLVTNRGVRLDQMDVQAMLDRLTAPHTTLAPEVRTVTIDGRQCQVVTATGSFRGIDNAVTSEEVAFDVETGLPALDVAYVGKDPVLKLGIRNLKLNVGVRQDAFELRDRLALVR